MYFAFYKTKAMRRSFRLLGSVAFFSLLTIAAFAQSTTITGNVRNGSNKDVVPAVSVTIKGTGAGTYTDERGNFRITTNQKLPITLVFTSVGYELQEKTVNNASENVQVDFVPASSLGVEVVVSASRVPERILESPVSIERVSAANIRNSPATSYYDILKNIKGVDLTYSSLTYATPSTRGFNSSGNARLNQLVDGMDNQAPGLNFSVGSVIGLTELDVESMELLPGASSALYGSGGMNGTLLINSKDPFKYQGLSYQVKLGIMHVDKKQLSSPSPYYDWSLRWAHKVTEKFAFKIGAQFIHAKDWIATDYSDYQAGEVALNQYGNVKAGTRLTDPNYDGVNVYGDETFTNLKALLAGGAQFAKGAYALRPASQQPIPLAQFAANVDALATLLGLPTAPAINVSRTGYLEKEVVNNNTVNFRLSGALHYKLTEKLEASVMGYFGTGNTVYTGSDRYSLKDLKMVQYKFELEHPNWFFRAYTTQENAGESFNSTVTTRIFNERWKQSFDQAAVTANPLLFANYWYGQYAIAYLTGRALGLDNYNGHLNARATADVGRPAPYSQQFTTLFDQVRKTPISKGGGLFLDKTDLYVYQGQYNFTEHIKVVELIAGLSYKKYVLNSEGTLFADTAGNIKINEFGAYAQVGKSFLADRLKLTAAGRYDYNENFDGRVTPRFTAVFKVVENHNIRGSYQTAYRFPTTQNQWINLVVGGGTILIGGLQDLRDFYQFQTKKVYTVQSVGAFGAALAGGTPPAQAVGLLQERKFDEYKAETMKSFELGYKGLFAKKILIDLYGYYGKYDNFLGRTIVLQSQLPNGDPMGLLSSATRRTFSVAVNNQNQVTTYGFGGSVDYLLPKNFAFTINVTADRITDVDPGFVAFFNSPYYRLNVGVSNSGFGHEKRFGFNVMMRKQDNYFYESDFRQGDVNSYASFDAQVSYKFQKIRSMMKIGGSNILNKYYKTAFANPEIGGIYYISFGYNVF